MKIISVDNFNRDDVSDKLICENINEYYGKHTVDFLNGKFSGSDSDDFYKLVEDDYKLFIWEP
jgi:uncharacterized protein YegJ (DUF2314 family)